MVQRDQALLGIDPGAHRLRRADQHADLAAVHVVEQPLLGRGFLEVLHEGDLGRRHAEAHQLPFDPAVGGEAPRRLDVERAEVRKHHLRSTRQRIRRAVRLLVAPVRRVPPDAVHVGDQLVQLVVRLVAHAPHNEAQVDGGVPAVGDDCEQDVVARLGRTRARLDGLDPRIQLALVGAERGARRRGHDLALAALHRRQLQVLAQVVLERHVGDAPEHRDQLGDVDELSEARHRLVAAGRLQFEFGAGVAEQAGPCVELVDAALRQRVRLHEPLQAEHLAQRVGDRRARGQDQRPGRVALRDEARLHIQVPGPLRAVGIDALEAAHVGWERELPELLRLVHDHLVDADLADGQHVVLAGGERFQLGEHHLLGVLDALPGQAVVAVHLEQQRLVGLDLLGDHAALEGGRGGDELERRVRDDDGVPVRRGRAGQEAGALVLDEVLLVGDQDAGVRVEGQELAAGLGQTVARHRHQGLADQAEALLLHDRGGHAHRLARTDRVRDVGAAGRDDAPDRPLLVRAQADGAAGAGQLQVRAVKGARLEIVELVIVDAGKAVCAVGVSPHPALERFLDPRQLLLGCLGLLLVQHARLDAVLPDRVVDLRQRAVQRVGQQQAGVPPPRAPLGRGRGDALVAAQVERPRRDLNGVAHPGAHADHLGRERFHHVGREPRPAQARGDVGRPQVLGLHAPQRLHVAREPGIERSGGFGCGEFGPDRPGQVGVGRLPLLDVADAERRVEEHRLVQLGRHLVARAAEQLGDAVEIDVAHLVQRHRERVGGGDDQRGGRGVDHALREDRPRLGGAGVLIVVLDGRHQPAVGVVEERLQVGPAYRLALLAGLRVGRGGHAREVDRAEVALERVVGDAQPHLGRVPRLVRLLGAQHRPGPVAHRDQRAEDACVLGRDALAARTAAHGHRHRHAVHHLRELAVEHEVAALLDRGALGGGADHHAGRLGTPGHGGIRGRVDALGAQGQRAAQRFRQRRPGVAAAGVGGTERPAGAAVPAQHHVGMLGEIEVHVERRLAVLLGHHLHQAVPLDGTGRSAGRALLEQQHVHHDLGAGRGQHAALRQPHRAHQVGHGSDVRAGRLVSLVHGEPAGDERPQAARLQPLDRARDEVVVQGQAELARGIAGTHRAVAERRVADRKLERLGDARLGEVLVPHPGVGVQQRRDPGRARVHLDRGERRLARQRFRHQRQEQSGAAARLQHRAAGEAHARHRAPDGAHDVLGRVMGILRGPREAGHLLGRDQLLQFGAQVLPARPERLAGTAEQTVGQLACPETDKAGQHLLLLGRGMAVLGRDGVRQADGLHVVGGARLPAMGQGALAHQPPVARRHARRRCRGGRRVVGIVPLGLAEAQAAHGGVEGEAAGQGGGVEQGQRELGRAGRVGHRG